MNKEKFSVITGKTPDGKQITGIFDMDVSIPDKNLPVSVWVKIPLKRPDDAGLSNHEEAESIIKVEDEIENIISGRFVGHLTFDGIREAYFYVDNAERSQVLLEDLQGRISYKFEFEIRNDPEWEVVASYLRKITE